MTALILTIFSIDEKVECVTDGGGRGNVDLDSEIVVITGVLVETRIDPSMILGKLVLLKIAKIE